MVLHHKRMFTRLDILGYQYADLNLMLADLLVAGPVDMKAVKTSSSRSVIEWSHVSRYESYGVLYLLEVKRIVEVGCGAQLKVRLPVR